MNQGTVNLKTLGEFVPRLRWVLLLLVLALVLAVMRIPASWGAYLMTQGNTIGLSGVSGTVWNGRARMSSIEIDNIQYSLGHLTWDFRPTSLLTLTPCVDVLAELDMQRIEGRACMGLDGRVRVKNASVDAPASLVQAGIPTPVDGQLAATLSVLEMQGETLEALDGRLSWTNARVQAEGSWFSLGSYGADFAYNGKDAIVAEVFDLEGPVDLDAQATLALVGGVDLQGDMELEPAFSDEIQAQDWLPMFLDSPERYRYKIDLQL